MCCVQMNRISVCHNLFHDLATSCQVSRMCMRVCDAVCELSVSADIHKAAILLNRNLVVCLWYVILTI